MKFLPIQPPPGAPDELLQLFEAVNNNLRDMEQLARRGTRAPLGSPGLPSIGFQNPGADGVGMSALSDVSAVQGMLSEADTFRHRAHNFGRGAVLEAVPQGAVSAGEQDTRISAYDSDVQGDPENFSRVDLSARSASQILKTVARGTAALKPLIIGHDAGTEVTDIHITTGGLVGIGMVPTQPLDVAGNIQATANYIWKSGTAFTGALDHANTAPRTYTFPDADITIAGLSDLTDFVHKSTPDTITAAHTFNPAVPGVPFILGANAQGQKVIGLNADLTDGFSASATPGVSTIAVSGGGGQLAVGWIPNLPASIITSGQLALARGGTNADLSGTGGAAQFLKQLSSGAAITVAAILAAELPSGIDASKIGAGTVDNTEFGYLDGVTSPIQTQISAIAAGIRWHAVKVATTANIALSGEQTLDGIATSTSRVLVKDQTDPKENGLYVSAAGAWSRAVDADTGAELEGSGVLVAEGATQANTLWLQTADSITIGVTNIAYVFFPKATDLIAGGGLTLTGLTLAVGAGQGIQVDADSITVLIDGTTLSKSGSGLRVASGGITNTEVNAAAAIAYSKLNLALSIVNADVAAGAAIAYSKLALAGALVTTDFGDDQVTFAKIQNISTDRLVGRDTAGTGDFEQLTATGGLEFTGTGIQTSAFTGDVTKAAGGTALTIANDAVTDAKLRNSGALTVLGRASNSSGDPADIAAGSDDTVFRRTASALDFGQLTVGMAPANVWTYAKIQQVGATDRFLGRKTAGAGNIEELTGTEATARLDTFTDTLKGLAPLSGGGTTNFLRADGTWAAPPGTYVSPLTTRGDMLTRDASVHVRVAIGAAGRLWRSDGTDPSWQTVQTSLGFTTKGDLVASDGSASGRFAAGVDRAVLIYLASAALGLEARKLEYADMSHKGTRGHSWVEHWETGLAQGETGWTTDHAGAAATVTVNTLTLADGTHPGIAEFTTGTTATGRASLHKGVASFVIGSGAIKMSSKIRIEDLSTVAQEFMVLVGAATAPSVPANGIQFLYDRLSFGANFQTQVVKAGTKTTTDSGIAFNADQWYLLEIEINAAGTSIVFKIDGTTVVTETGANIPVVAIGPRLTILKSAGLTPRLMYVDHYGKEQEI